MDLLRHLRDTSTSKKNSVRGPRVSRQNWNRAPSVGRTYPSLPNQHADVHTRNIPHTAKDTVSCHLKRSHHHPTTVRATHCTAHARAARFQKTRTRFLTRTYSPLSRVRRPSHTIVLRVSKFPALSMMSPLYLGGGNQLCGGGDEKHVVNSVSITPICDTGSATAAHACSTMDCFSTASKTTVRASPCVHHEGLGLAWSTSCLVEVLLE